MRILHDNWIIIQSTNKRHLVQSIWKVFSILIGSSFLGKRFSQIFTFPLNPKKYILKNVPVYVSLCEVTRILIIFPKFLQKDWTIFDKKIKLKKTLMQIKLRESNLCKNNWSFSKYHQNYSEHKQMSLGSWNF